MTVLRLTTSLVLATIGLRAGAQAPTVRRLTLDEAVALAQKQGLGMRAAREQLSAAEWTERAFNGRLRPGVALSGMALNLDHSINSITLPDGTKQYIGQSNNQSFAGITMTQPLLATGGALSVSSALERTDQFGNRSTQSWQSTPVTLGITQPLFRPRQLLWDKRQQDASAALAHSRYLEAREDVAQTAVDAFFGLYAADVGLRNATANASIADTLFRVNQQRYTTAVISRMDLGRSELAALRSRIDADNARIARDRAEAALKRTLNLASDGRVEIVAPENIPTLTIDPVLAVAEALRNGSIADQIAADSLASLWEIERARLGNGFSANLGASVGFNQTAPDLGLAYQSPLGRQRLSLSVGLPILQWGAGHAEVEAAKAGQAYATTQGLMARQLVAENARFAALQTVQSMQALGLSAKADTLAVTQFAIARAQYAAGNLALTDYLLAQQDKDNAVAGHVQALRAFWTQYYALRRVTLFDFITGKRLGD